MKRRYLLAGAGKGRFRPSYEHFHEIFGFKHSFRMFNPEEWEGEYVDREILFNDPSILDGVDVCLLVLEWGFCNRSEIRAAIDYAHNVGCIIGGELDGPTFTNIQCTSPREMEFRRNFDFLSHGMGRYEVKAAVEHIYGIPYFCNSFPIVADHFLREFEECEKYAWEKPSVLSNYFMLGHGLQDVNYMTLQVAELFQIPLLVNFKHRGLVDEAERWISMIESQGGFHYVRFTKPLTHQEWLYQAKHCRGIFYLTRWPSCGRASVYAAIANKVSLTTPSGWQDLLYPELVLEPDFRAGVNWDKKVLWAETLIPTVQKRLLEYSPEKCQTRFEAFLAANF